jgi:hypothetical protein
MKKKFNLKPKGFIKTILMVLIWISQFYFYHPLSIFSAATSCQVSIAN